MLPNLKPCEMCGKHDNLTDIIIEGSSLSVCKNCVKYGSVIIKKPTTLQELKPIRKKPKLEEEKEFISPEYPERIKNARERFNLKQEELAQKIAEKESVIRQLESGHLKPNFSLTKKLEQHLKITLIESHDKEKNKKEQKIDFTDSSITVGDLVKFKKK
ncbi:MAG: multiprotein bridging factor aMBF1 [Nanoarchaeota archaeon]